MSETKTIKELFDMGIPEEEIIKSLVKAGMDEEDATLMVSIELGEIDGDVIQEEE